MTRMAIDVGGTFTDLCLLKAGGTIETVKVPTNSDQPGVAIEDGVQRLADCLGTTIKDLLADLDIVVFGTTLSTNALITHQVDAIGLLITAGFRDTLAFREAEKADPFDWNVDYPDPFVPRGRTRPVRERMSAEGTVVLSLNEDDVLAQLDDLRQRDVKAIAVCYLWATANPAHELRTRELVARHWPEVRCVLSHEISPVIGEYRRWIAAAINASLLGIIGPHLTELEESLNGLGFSGALLVASCDGGVVTVRDAAERPVLTVGSGPTLAPIAGSLAVEDAGIQAEAALIVDMGGTTFDISIARDGRTIRTGETKIGDDLLGINRVDIQSIGAGGGSIAWVDDGGLLRVGPASAGSVPGPAAFGRGGKSPTVTDANILLGYLNPDAKLGGAIAFDVQAAADAVTGIASALHVEPLDAARAIYETVNEEMAVGMRASLTREGVDAARSVLVAGGGASGIHIVSMAETLGFTRILVPNRAGTLSAIGGAVADLSRDFSDAFYLRSDDVDADSLNARLSGLREEADQYLDQVDRRGYTRRLEAGVEARYEGQAWPLHVAFALEDMTPSTVDQLAKRFHEAHENTYGTSFSDKTVEFLRWSVRAILENPNKTIRRSDAASSNDGRRRVYLGDGDWADSRIIQGSASLREDLVYGPLIIEEATETVVVPEDWTIQYIQNAGLLIAPKYKTETLMSASP